MKYFYETYYYINHFSYIYLQFHFSYIYLLGSITRICIIGNETEEDNNNLNKPVFRDTGDTVSVSSICKLIIQRLNLSKIVFNNKDKPIPICYFLILDR